MIRLATCRSINRSVKIVASTTTQQLQVRAFTNSSVNYGKSFSKKSTYDSSKNKKGAGKDLNFSKLLIKSNFKSRAKDQEIINTYENFSINSINNELNHNKIFKYSESILKKLYISGSFVSNQYNELYSKPITLLRELETNKILEFFNSTLNNQSKENRLILTGESGSGKSTLITQFQSLVLENENSILLPLTNTESLVNGKFDFKLNQESNLYDQQRISKVLLRKFKNLNEDNLKKIKLSNDYTPKLESPTSTSSSASNGLPIFKKGESSLFELIEYSLKNSSKINNTLVFVKTIEELTIQSNFNVYLTIDNFNALTQFSMTKYRDTKNRFIYFQNFQIIKTLTDLISGELSFQKGGVLLSTSGLYKNNDTIKVAVNEIEPNHYSKFNEWDKNFTNKLNSNNGLQNLKISNFNLPQIKSLMNEFFKLNLIHNEYNLNENLINLNNDNELFLNKFSEKKYIISGNGNPRSLIKSCVFSYV
ncbi:hypothetical protein B5S30_g4798 [[Candida] boidinii]|nr:hypothetical protein B5S30_g4798 [[Candida] boidinii]